ncbi:serine protease [Sorangium cellulosum]|uniref:trypsin-like serine peptidase n=1 Tax=Sorangium cellulosum TaxID=56 RepID=UPI003D9A7C34
MITPAALLLAGCGMEEEVEVVESSREAKIIGTAEIPEAFISGKGKRFVLRGPAKFVADPVWPPKSDSSNEASRAERGRSEDEMTREELAHAFRPVMLHKGHEYILEKPDYEFADAVIAARGKELKTEGSEGRATVKNAVDLTPGLTEAQAVLGTDTREQKRDNTTFPSRTRVFITNGNMTGACSGQLIGPTTILTAAHCVHNGTGWLSTRSWSPGVDSQDANAFPYQGGSTYPDTSGNAPIAGCYKAMVSSEWASGDTSVSYDFAFLELGSMYPEGCGFDPGNDLGWHGLWVASEAAIEDRSGNLYGYPAEKATWPQIWGGTGPVTDEGVALWYDIDTTGGQSGSAVYMFDNAEVRYVVGIHKGFNGDLNYGRKMTTGLYTWLVTHTAL